MIFRSATREMYYNSTYPEGIWQDWFCNGLRHREDGPAVIMPTCKQVWYSNGKRIKEIRSNGTVGYHP